MKYMHRNHTFCIFLNAWQIVSFTGGEISRRVVVVYRETDPAWNIIMQIRELCDFPERCIGRRGAGLGYVCHFNLPAIFFELGFAVISCNRKFWWNTGWNEFMSAVFIWSRSPIDIFRIYETFSLHISFEVNYIYWKSITIKWKYSLAFFFELDEDNSTVSWNLWTMSY